MRPALFVSVLVPFAVGFFLSNYGRSVNAVLSPYLIAEFRLTAGDLGLLTSVYFFVSALFQLPLGMLLDRYGPRRVQGTMLAVGACGFLLFGAADGIVVASLGRIIMGIGAAGALMTSLQAVTLWFAPDRRPLLNGWVLGAGGLGVLAATLPTELALQVSDWRHLMFATALASLVAAAAIFGIVPERPDVRPPLTLADQLRGLAFVYRSRLFWRVSPLFSATIGAMFAFQTLWAGPWLKDVVRFSPTEVASDLLVIGVLQTASFVGVGVIATWLGRHGIRLMQIVGVGTGLFILSQAGLLLPAGVGRWPILLGMGCLANVDLLLYPVLAKHFPADLIGRANTALNLFVFVGAFAVQYAVGALIDLFPAIAPGSYPTQAYQVAFGVMLAVEIAAWLWYSRPGEDRRTA